MRRDGLTLVELLVVALLAGLLLAMVASTTLGSRRLYQLDQERTAANQNLRAALDLLAAEIRQAGERLPASLPAVEVRGGRELLLRRNLSEVVLTVCDRNGISGNQDNIPVADKNPPQIDEYIKVCAFHDGDGNGMDDRIDRWRALRLQAPGGVLSAFIFNPQARAGEWFIYDREDQSGFHIHKGNSTRWSRTYAYPSLVYLLEERRYFLSDGLLQLALQGSPQGGGVVAGVEAFQVRARARGNWYTDFPQGTLTWKDLEAVEVVLRVRAGGTSREMRLQAFPRNVLSR